MNEKTTNASLKRQATEDSDLTLDFSAEISAWMDGELAGGRSRLVCRGVLADESCRAQWSRYHLIGDALRDNLPADVMVDIAPEVRARLDEDASASRRALPAIVRNPRMWGLAASLVVASVIVVGSWSGQELAPTGTRLAGNETTGVVNASSTEAVEQDIAQAELDDYFRNHNQALADTGEAGRMLPYLNVAEFTVEPVAASGP
jgi:sigma-E factor negative regulatory protein RseA